MEGVLRSPAESAPKENEGGAVFMSTSQGTIEETRKLCFVRFLPTIYGFAPWFLNAELAPGACGKVAWHVIVRGAAGTGTCQRGRFKAC